MHLDSRRTQKNKHKYIELFWFKKIENIARSINKSRSKQWIYNLKHKPIKWLNLIDKKQIYWSNSLSKSNQWVWNWLRPIAKNINWTVNKKLDFWQFKKKKNIP